MSEKVSVQRFLISGVSIIIFLFFTWPIPTERLTGTAGLVLLSKEGEVILHERAADTGAHSEYKSIESYPPSLIETVIRAEDRWYWAHPGVNGLSVLRAALQNIRYRKTVSGASTITQQMVRIAYRNELPRRALFRKIFEVIFALKFELQFSKDEILEAYLNRVPLRFNSEGFASASKRIFLKDISLLSQEEISALTVLARGSYPGKEIFTKRYRYLTDSSDNEKEKAILEMVFRDSPASSESESSGVYAGKSSPHFSDWLRNNSHGLKGKVRTEVSSGLNRKITEIADQELRILEDRNVTNAAVVVLEYNSERNELYLRALAGSRNFSDEKEGQVNGAFSVRTAGSTLKPFAYALAMDRLNLRPYSTVDDENITFQSGTQGEVYRPLNYDLNYWGKMSVREALATSRNIPPVALIEKMGLQAFYILLKDLEFNHIESGPEYYGPGVVLGSAGVTLLDLTKAYSIFPAKGELIPLRVATDPESGNPIYYGKRKRIFSEKAAYMISGILSDRNARRKAFGHRSFLDFPFKVAAKTGTSKDFRDAWTVGFTDRYIVGVWAGNFSNDSMNGVSGSYGAGRIFHQIIRHLESSEKYKIFNKKTKSIFEYPETWKRIDLCKDKGCLSVGANCNIVTEYFPPGDATPPLCSEKPVHITEGRIRWFSSPAEGERFLINPHIPVKSQHVPINIQPDSEGYYTVKLNDRIITEKNGPYKTSVPAVPGHYKLEIIRDNKVLKTLHYSVE
jgi:penicillin-binding protein 1C